MRKIGTVWRTALWAYFRCTAGCQFSVLVGSRPPPYSELPASQRSYSTPRPIPPGIMEGTLPTDAQAVPSTVPVQPAAMEVEQPLSDASHHVPPSETDSMNVEQGSESTEKLDDDDIDMSDAVAGPEEEGAETTTEKPTEETKVDEEDVSRTQSTRASTPPTKPTPNPTEETKEVIDLENPTTSVHHPAKDLTCVVEQHISSDGKKVAIEPLKLAIKQMRDDGYSWTRILAEVFGYRYDQDWRLKKLKNDEGFTFIDQKHYELLGDVILSYVQEVLVVTYHLVELWIPEDSKGPKCNVFHSPDLFTNTTKCLLLIQGAGAVRAGQWARSVCINAKLTEGTVFPALEFAAANGFSTIVFNPNKTHSDDHKPIPYNDSMENHSRFVWKKYIRKAPAEQLYIIAHSCGGMCTAALLETFEDEFVERVKAVAFTDSVHGSVRCSSKGKRHLGNISVDFVASTLPLGTLVRPLRDSYK